jgi:uncharacterized UPF0146 family protein
MRNIKYIGTKPIANAFFDRTGIVWTPGMVETVLDDVVALQMLKHPDVFEDAGDVSLAGEVGLYGDVLKVGGVAATAAQKSAFVDALGGIGGGATPSQISAAVGQAETARDAAQAARDAAEDSVQYTYLVEDGAALTALTGMTTGQKAYVRSTEHVWNYSGSVWVDLGLSPTAAKVDKTELSAVVEVSIGATELAVEDEYGNTFFRVTEDDIQHPAIEVLQRQSAAQYIPPYEEAMSPVAAVAEIIHVTIYGQSLSVGESTLTALSLDPVPGAYKFSGTGNPVTNNGASDAVNYASLVNLTSAAGRETPAPGFAAMVAQLLLEENGIDVAAGNQKLLLSCPGAGGTRLDALDKVSDGFTRVLTGINYGGQRSVALGKSYLPQVLYMIQGESDYDTGAVHPTPAVDYKATFAQMLIDLKADAPNAAGRDPLVIWYQTASHRRGVGYDPIIAMAQIAMVEDNANFVFSTPVYPLPFSADLLHLNNIGSMVLGAYGGLAMKRAMWDGVKTHPLMFDAPIRVGTSSVLLKRKYPGTPLVLDGDAYNPGNFGFSGVTDALANNPVVSVALAGPNAIRITFTNPVSVGDKVRYAWIGSADYGAGCVRDSQGDNIVFSHASVTWPMHNWAPIQELTI